jgi:hypothetical protein
MRNWFRRRDLIQEDIAVAARRAPTLRRGLAGLLPSERVVVVDTETTGVYRTDRIVEIACVTLAMDGTVLSEWETLVNRSVTSVPPGCTASRRPCSTQLSKPGISPGPDRLSSTKDRSRISERTEVSEDHGGRASTSSIPPSSSPAHVIAPAISRIE